jgi:carbon storage regulator CsrA
MLVFTRKVGQQVVFPECQVIIDVLNISKSRVRLGIVAPSATPVHRSELWRRIQREGFATREQAVDNATETAACDPSSSDAKG